MKPSLELKPNSYEYQQLLMKFADGAPLTCNQLNFLSRHERALSSRELDPALGYYLKHYHHRHADDHSFLLSGEKLTPELLANFRRRLKILLQGTQSHLELKITADEFRQFRELTYSELILYHGNQLLTGAPFYHGGIAPLILFQWGNLFGVAKYVVLAEEKALKSNILIYFEDMQERKLEECVNQYFLRLQLDMKQQMQLAPSMQPRPQKHEEPVLTYQSPFRITPPSPAPFRQEREEEK